MQRASKMSNKYVETVLGPVDSNKLGRVLTHEHLALDFDAFYVPPPEILQKFTSDIIDLQNIGIIKQYPYSNKYNIHFDDIDSANAVLEDVKFYKASGGGTIVENTSHGIKRNIQLMKKTSHESGVHVIVGTGHYVASTQSDSAMRKSEEEMFNLITNELTVGCYDCPSVKAGFIGEVGSTWPIADFEKRAIRAAAHVQEQLNCSVSFHPGRDVNAPFEILRIYMEAGGDAKKAIMSHLDRTFARDDELLTFAELGSYCQYDLFGIECSYYQLDTKMDMPSDAQRIDKMRILKEDGRLEKILMSHDIHTKHRLMNFGGHGYAHIINNVLPKMLIKGFTKEEIDTITINNPKNWLTS
ncbi:PREDICTED: phosphotriesterase-related protein isoform X3 [Ceratosolen solmsi marchali]|uniref:Phosphotriesterase-related protein isoform X3 n=1 Tax=Ceratosolen solmsi marchali TaxID=326594 RepID=A0AAJ7DWN7_9HYME|nr:PREDICTED: phosphotriesterase-related protein isoform X3 [Ceratosolen solmsi marchali]